MRFKFGVGRVTRFYVPLLMQAFSQSLTYPLVAGIVTHGKYGVDALTAFSQGQVVMFLIGCIGAGLPTTGLVFAKTWFGYESFKRLNGWMAGVLLVVQALLAVPPLDGLIFRTFLNLPLELAEVARWTMLFGVVMQAGFFLRNVPMVVLFNNLESGKANNATIARILVTLACAAVFPYFGLTGPWWGLFALTLGVWTELLITYLYARPYVAALPNRPTGTAFLPPKNLSSLVWEQFRFTMPLSFGGFLLALSPIIIAAFVGRSANATDMLTVHYVTIGVANPVAYAALRMQAVSIKFLPEYEGDRRLLGYAVVAGLLLGLIPLVFSFSGPGSWYFGGYQNVPDRLLATVRLAIGIYALIPVIHAIRARIEGIAAARKHPTAIMAGQIAYSLSLLTACAVMLPMGFAGWTIALVAIFIAPICTTIAVYAALWLPAWRPALRL